MSELIVFHVQDANNTPIIGALVQGDGATLGHWQGLTNACGDFFATLGSDHYVLTISANSYTTRIMPADLANSGIVTIGLEKAFNHPTRDRIIHVKDNFCNLRDADDIPIFEPFIGTIIGTAKADDWIVRARDAGNTHYDLFLSGDYPENLGWIDRYPLPGHDWTNELDNFKRILDYVIQHDKIPHVHLAGDGQSPSNGGYVNAGLTYGWWWSIKNIPRILKELKDYIHECLWCSGYDSCFPIWSRDQQIQWMQMMRSIDNEICISTEFGGPGSVGYSHMGNASNDWTPETLGMIDTFLVEVNSFPPNDEGVKETATRLLGPKATNAPTTPYYLVGLTKEIGICIYESNAYESIRKFIQPSDVSPAMQTCAKYGFTDFGNGGVA